MIKTTFTLKSSKSKCLTGKLSVPGDKSISIRSVMLASWGIGKSKITNLSKIYPHLENPQALQLAQPSW
mgnify:CR=1 FL=1